MRNGIIHRGAHGVHIRPCALPFRIAAHLFIRRIAQFIRLRECFCESGPRNVRRAEVNQYRHIISRSILARHIDIVGRNIAVEHVLAMYVLKSIQHGKQQMVCIFETQLFVFVQIPGQIHTLQKFHPVIRSVVLFQRKVNLYNVRMSLQRMNDLRFPAKASEMVLIKLLLLIRNQNAVVRRSGNHFRRKKFLDDNMLIARFVKGFVGDTESALAHALL